MPTYIAKHKRGGYKYQKWIPADLQDAWKPKRRMFVGYIKAMPQREAEKIARAWAVRDDEEIASLRTFTPATLKFMSETGKSWRDIMSDPAFRDQITEEPDGTKVTRSPNLEDHARKWIAYTVDRKVNKSKSSWDALYADWIKIKAPAKPRNHATTIETAKNFFGLIDCRNLTQADIARFRDEKGGELQGTRQVLERHLQHIRGMFAAAIREPSSPFFGMINPATGVQMLGKPTPRKDGADKVFAPGQVRTILETAEAKKFGGKRHNDILWILRLLAFTGMRPNEVCQTQANDIQELEGVKFIRVTANDAVTGNPHSEKSVKTSDTRLVPLHPDISDFYEYVMGFAKDDFIFKSFPFNADNGRAAWLIGMFPRFLREDAKIVEPTKRLTLYGLRHSFITAMRNAKVPEDIRTAIVGHKKGQHARYGSTDIKILAEAIASTKPLG